MEVSHEVDIADPGNRRHVTMRILHKTMRGNNGEACKSDNGSLPRNHTKKMTMNIGEHKKKDSKRRLLYLLVITGDRDCTSTRDELMCNQLAHEVLVTGEGQVKVTHITLVML